MEFKDGVIYVSPNGIAFDEDILKEQSRTLAEKTADIFINVREALVPIIKGIVDFIRNILKDVFESIKSLDVKKIQERIDNEQYMRQSWRVPKNTIKQHQVLNKKPKFARIRNNI